MRLPQTGGCQCGKLRYEITQAPHMICTCHCTKCQRFTGSAFSIAMLVDAPAFHLTGEPRALLNAADSGRSVSRWVCPECASWICSAGPGIKTSPFRTRRNLGRHLLAASYRAFLDPEQTALGRIAQ